MTDEIRFTLRLSRRLYDQIIKEAKRRGESVSVVIRDAIRKGL